MNLNDNSARLRELDNDIRNWIDIREGIGREIAACQAKPGDNTRRRKDRLLNLETEYAKAQQRILDIDLQIRSRESSGQTRTTGDFKE